MTQNTTFAEMTEWQLFQDKVEKHPITGIYIAKHYKEGMYLHVVSPDQISENQFYQMQKILKTGGLHATMSDGFVSTRAVLYAYAQRNEEILAVRSIQWMDIVVNPKMPWESQLVTMLFCNNTVKAEYRGQGIGTALTTYMQNEGLARWMSALRSYKGRYITTPETYEYADGSKRIVSEEYVRAALNVGFVIVRAEIENERWEKDFRVISESSPFYVQHHPGALATMKSSYTGIALVREDYDQDGIDEKIFDFNLSNFDGQVRRNERATMILVNVGFRRFANDWFKSCGQKPMAQGYGEIRSGTFDDFKDFPRSIEELSERFFVVDISEEADVEASLRKMKLEVTKPTVFIVNRSLQTIQAYGFKV